MCVLTKEKLFDVNLRFSYYMDVHKFVFVTDKAVHPIRIKYVFSSNTKKHNYH